MREYDLLLYLASNADQVLPRQRILDEVWGYNFFGDENNIEVYVRYLRTKLGDTTHERIQTVRGVGTGCAAPSTGATPRRGRTCVASDTLSHRCDGGSPSPSSPCCCPCWCSSRAISF